ncbi:MAG: hypothetical protein JWR72_1094 [Flavisolibacter sp.]|nr:hypothetical protein [Flavisolibacter sp.]
MLDNYNNITYVNRQAGSIYKQTAPLKNAMRALGDWNVYDVIYMAPRFKEAGNEGLPQIKRLYYNYKRNATITDETLLCNHKETFTS